MVINCKGNTNESTQIVWKSNASLLFFVDVNQFNL